jgi:pimeloyl-ACP methyl ester carboxylesterase
MVSESASGAIMVPPRGQRGDTVVLLYFPGALCHPESYIDLMEVTQQAARKYNIEFLACILRYPGEQPATGMSAEQARELAQAARAEIQAEFDIQPDENNTFLAGHSLGSALAQQVACLEAQAGRGCKGAIVHAGWYREDSMRCEVPVCTILGDRDGVIRLSHAATQRHKALLKHAQAAARARHCPIAILAGLSHTSFANGRTTLCNCTASRPPHRSGRGPRPLRKRPQTSLQCRWPLRPLQTFRRALSAWTLTRRRPTSPRSCTRWLQTSLAPPVPPRSDGSWVWRGVARAPSSGGAAHLKPLRWTPREPPSPPANLER